MLSSEGKISLRQAMFFYIIILVSPVIRFLPTYTSIQAKQAGWVSPFITLVPMIVLIYIIRSFYTRYKDQPMMEIICDIMGRWLGRFVVILYFLWSIVLIGLYSRYYVERLLSAIYPNVAVSVFAIPMLVLIGYTLRNGITGIARMSEVLLPIIVITTALLIAFLLPMVRLDFITPISIKDVVPIFKGSIATISIGIYFFLIFFMSDYINDKEKILKAGLQSNVFYVIYAFLTVFTTIGTLGSSVVERLSVPFLTAVKHISVLDTIENIESLIVGTWIYADYVLLCTFIFISLNMIKYLFTLSETKHLLNIFLVFIYFFTLGICISRHELTMFSNKILIPMNITLGLFLPVLLFIVGKIRRRI